MISLARLSWTAHLGDPGRQFHLLDRWSSVAASPQHVHHSIESVTLGNLRRLLYCLDLVLCHNRDIDDFLDVLELRGLHGLLHV